MNVASLKICKELYELSGWSNTGLVYYHDRPKDHPPVLSLAEGLAQAKQTPAYDLGYLLRKIPTGFELSKAFTDDPIYFVRFGPTNHTPDYPSINENDRSPENVVALLCIGLFKKGVLKRD